MTLAHQARHVPLHGRLFAIKSPARLCPEISRTQRRLRFSVAKKTAILINTASHFKTLYIRVEF